MSLSDEIKIIRQRSFLSQSEFAKILHVSYTTVNRWETGKAIPNLSAMKELKSYCETNSIPSDSLETEWLKFRMEGKQQ